MTKSKTNPLLDAADYIEEVGWCRGDWYQPNGKACLAGAVGVVTGALVPLTERARERAIAHLLKTESYLDREGAEAEVPNYRWSKDKRKFARYTGAIEVLATTIRADAPAELESRLAEYTSSIQVLAPEERDERIARYRREFFVNRVVEHNDGAAIVGDDGKARFKTTKRGAVKLLRKAAEAYAA